MRQIFYVCGLAAAILTLSVPTAHAQTTAVGPYYASPSWDQTLACTASATCPRFIVLSNFNNEAVLDRETGLVWEKDPSNAQVKLNDAWAHCLELQTGGRMGWRLPKSDELFSLLDPTQINNSSGRPALPIGNPFVGIGGGKFWTVDHDAPPFNGNLIFVATDLGVIQTADTNFSLVRGWCVRAPGSRQF